MKNPSPLDRLGASPDDVSEGMGYLGHNPQSCGDEDDDDDYNQIPDLGGLRGKSERTGYAEGPGGRMQDTKDGSSIASIPGQGSGGKKPSKKQLKRQQGRDGGSCQAPCTGCSIF